MTMFELDTFRRKVNSSGHSFYAIYVNSLEVDNNYYYLLSIIYYLLYYYLLSIIYYLLYYYLLSIIYYLIGNVVIYVPIDVYSIVLVLYQDQSMNLIRNPNESEIVAIKLKRKLGYKQKYHFYCVRARKVLEASKCLVTKSVVVSK